jgi:hypothetical protein
MTNNEHNLEPGDLMYDCYSKTYAIFVEDKITINIYDFSKCCLCVFINQNSDRCCERDEDILLIQ